ncbi:MAG TPA: hypothetical protein VMS94_03520 [Acidobacteriota bacterium]|nr:hypothetical protein [Acidobacteriota bacterium]
MKNKRKYNQNRTPKEQKIVVPCYVLQYDTLAIEKQFFIALNHYLGGSE